jgi:tetratricopeptide (TPR) repeat protein
MLNNLAVLYYDQGRYAEAEPLFNRAIAVRKGALGADHSDVGQTMYRLARLYQAQKRLTDALSLHRRALDIRTKAQGPEHPDVIQSLDGIAHTYEEQGNWPSAADAARRARDIVISRAQKGALTSGAAAVESGRRRSPKVGRCSPASYACCGDWQRSSPHSIRQLKESYLAAEWGNNRSELSIGPDVCPSGQGSEP